MSRHICGEDWPPCPNCYPDPDEAPGECANCGAPTEDEFCSELCRREFSQNEEALRADYQHDRDVDERLTGGTR